MDREEQERQIIESLLAQGLTIPKIAENLGVSLGVIRRHVLQLVGAKILLRATCSTYEPGPRFREYMKRNRDRYPGPGQEITVYVLGAQHRSGPTPEQMRREGADIAAYLKGRLREPPTPQALEG